jgi:tetratricopeptide (TPR) repeat protein
LKFEDGDKIKFKDYGKTLLELHKPNALELDDAFILKVRGDVKKELQNYEGALLDLDKANILKPNDASILAI